MIERVQKKCLRIIYGYELNYDELLQISGLETMESRRIKLFKKFTTKASENPKYRSWFPLKDTLRNTRNPRPYLEDRANSDGQYKSPLFAMRRIMNNNPPISLDLTDLSDAFNAPYLSQPTLDL